MEEVVVLIDSGATHNFIIQRLVDELKLLLTETTNYGIFMAQDLPSKAKGFAKE